MAAQVTWAYVASMRVSLLPLTDAARMLRTRLAPFGYGEERPRWRGACLKAKGSQQGVELGGRGALVDPRQRCAVHPPWNIDSAATTLDCPPGICGGSCSTRPSQEYCLQHPSGNASGAGLSWLSVDVIATPLEARAKMLRGNTHATQGQCAQISR